MYKNISKFLFFKSMVILLCLGLSLNIANAKYNEPNDYSLVAGFTSDQFFGFAPMMMGEYKIADQLGFTFYGLYWSGGTGASWGNWTEFGVGVNYKLTDWMQINPQIGIVNGNLLSSSAKEVGVLGDGIVPNLTVNIANKSIEAQVYAGLYMPLREIAFTKIEPTIVTTTSSYSHYWLNCGYKFSSFLSVGAHYEQLAGGTKNNEVTVYQWAGPYIQFTDPKGKGSLRFSGGTDLVDKPTNDSFFKLTTLINL